MDLPITKPSTISYAEDCDFKEVLKDLSSKNHNGFIRVTEGNDEGFILFKNGKEIAASFERSTRTDAINKIQNAMNDGSTLIEIFNVRESQIDFLMEINQPYVLGSEAYKIIDELKNMNSPEPQPMAVPKPKSVAESMEEPERSEKLSVESESNLISAPKIEELENSDVEADANRIETVKSDSPTYHEKNDDPVNETVETDIPVVEHSETEQKIVNESVPDKSSLKPEVNTENTELTEEISKNIPQDNISQKDTESNDSIIEESENKEMPEMETEPLDRTELLKKYGIRDIQDEDVENILESYKGGSVSDEDVEKIELTLMNKIKKSLLGIPKIKGAEVMVFLENSRELTGKVNIIIETESKGFLSRIMGDSNEMKLEKQIIDMSQIEIRKSFRKYPEIVDKFDVNVEIS